jgi:hypothetical protein
MTGACDADIQRMASREHRVILRLPQPGPRAPAPTARTRRPVVRRTRPSIVDRLLGLAAFGLCMLGLIAWVLRPLFG